MSRHFLPLAFNMPGFFPLGPFLSVTLGYGQVDAARRGWLWGKKCMHKASEKSVKNICGHMATRTFRLAVPLLGRTLKNESRRPCVDP